MTLGDRLTVLGETAYPISTPSARVRIARFAPFLRQEGIELRYAPTLSGREYAIVSSPGNVPGKVAVLGRAAARAALRARPEHDLLLVHRLRLLSPVPGLDPPRQLDIYDFDDALPLGSTSAINRHFEWAKQEARRSVSCARRAELVIAGNPFLAGLVREGARRVEIVPSCIDPTLQSLRGHEDSDVVTVGWIGSRTTGAYLEPVLPVFAQINASQLRAKLVLIGADLAFQAPWLEQRAWSVDSENRDLASFDIGIMPLPDSDWTRGKCGYKLLQYFGAGLPTVASPVGVNVDLTADHGLLAQTSEEWRRALDLLIGDVGERRDRGAAARRFVEQRFSYQHWAPELAALLRSVRS